MPAFDLAGRRFGRLVAVSITKVTLRAKARVIERRAWECRCDCGRSAVVQTAKLISGHTGSCGCLRADRSRATAAISSRKHGGRSWPEYRVWRGMISRCSLPSLRNFKDYGGRGIAVCDRWRFGEGGKTGFACFMADVGRRPSEDLSIDRVDNDGPYAPGNCRWATRGQQERNKRRRPKEIAS